MPALKVLQSLRAMERRQTDGVERSLEQNVRLVAEAGFAGVSAHRTDRAAVRRLPGLLGERGLVAERQCVPRTVDDPKPVLDIAAGFAVGHVDLQPDVRPRRLEDSVPLVEGWMRLAAEAGIPVHVETHRARMTTDLHVVLGLLDRFPELPPVADLSHFVVAREVPWPVPEEEQAKIRRVLDNARAPHGRVASREQVQIEIPYPHHRPWVEPFLVHRTEQMVHHLFGATRCTGSMLVGRRLQTDEPSVWVGPPGWWGDGLERMAARLPPAGNPRFTCELGPEPYAITGPDGNGTTDRWAGALALKAMVEEVHAGLRRERAGP